MQLPKKINPDRVKDAIVEVKYYSEIPFEVLVGFIFKSLDDESFTYLNRPPALNIPQVSGKLATLSLGNQYIFTTEKIKLQLQPNSLIFNILGSSSYIGWQDYFPEIEKVLSQIAGNGIVKYYNRVGVRFISEYPDIDLKDCIKFNFTFGLPKVDSKTYSFKSEFELNQKRVILNLNNRLPILRNKEEPDSNFISRIDIDIVKTEIEVADDKFSELLEVIDSAHEDEKYIFFNILKSEFLKTLNPEY